MKPRCVKCANCHQMRECRLVKTEKSKPKSYNCLGEYKYGEIFSVPSLIGISRQNSANPKEITDTDRTRNLRKETNKPSSDIRTINEQKQRTN